MSRSDWPEYKPVVILGAGPAGLSVGYELARRGVDFVIIERGPEAGESFANFPRNIFFGPWLNNLLPGSKVSWSWLLRRSTQPAYAWYLAEYGRQNQLPIFCDTTVHQVTSQDGRFAVDTSRGRIWARLVINATGYFAKPFIPPYPGLEQASLRHIHVAEYREASTLRQLLGRSSGRVLVVGKRLSAGETMCELHRSGFQVGLSHRNLLTFGPSATMEAFFAPFNWIKETISVALRLRLDSYPKMAGGESAALIRQGHVLAYPDIQRIDGDEVYFVNGTSARFDAIVFATGYEAALDHLRPLIGNTAPVLEGMELASHPGMFFLGLDNQRTYRSRFLRGIREDSKVVADLVARRVTSWGSSAASQTRVVVPSEVLIDLDHSPEEAAAS